MPPQHQEKIGVIAQGIIDRLSLRTPTAGIARIYHVMGGKNSATIAIDSQQVICPVQNTLLRSGVVFKMDNDEIQSARAEQFVVIIVIGTIVTTVIPAPIETRYSKVLVVLGGCSAAAAANRRLVMVAHRQAVRNAIGKQCGQRIFDQAIG